MMEKSHVFKQMENSHKLVQATSLHGAGNSHIFPQGGNSIFSGRP